MWLNSMSMTIINYVWKYSLWAAGLVRCRTPSTKLASFLRSWMSLTTFQCTGVGLCCSSERRSASARWVSTSPCSRYSSSVSSLRGVPTDPTAAPGVATLPGVAAALPGAGVPNGSPFARWAEDRRPEWGGRIRKKDRTRADAFRTGPASGMYFLHYKTITCFRFKNDELNNL